jgi:hypothetical protein
LGKGGTGEGSEEGREWGKIYNRNEGKGIETGDKKGTRMEGK